MRSRPNQNGFTIIEVLVALGIFAIGFLAVAGMQIRGVTSTVKSREKTEALELASRQVEWLQGLPFYDDRLDLDGNGAEEDYDIAPELVAGDHQMILGAYTIRWSVTDNEPLDPLPPGIYTPVGGSPLTISKTIAVRVSSTGSPGRVLASLEMIKVWEQGK